MELLSELEKSQNSINVRDKSINNLLETNQSIIDEFSQVPADIEDMNQKYVSMYNKTYDIIKGKDKIIEDLIRQCKEQIALSKKITATLQDAQNDIERKNTMLSEMADLITKLFPGMVEYVEYLDKTKDNLN